MNHYCGGKAVSITYSECVFAPLGIQRATHIRHTAICSLPLLYYIFPHYLINGTVSEKKLLNIKCVFRFSLQLLSETFLILRRTERDIIINIHREHKVPVFFNVGF